MTPDSYRIRLGGGLLSPGALLVPHFIVLFSFLPRNSEQAFYWYVFVRLRGGYEGEILCRALVESVERANTARHGALSSSLYERTTRRPTTMKNNHKRCVGDRRTAQTPSSRN